MPFSRELMRSEHKLKFEYGLLILFPVVLNFKSPIPPIVVVAENLACNHDV